MHATAPSALLLLRLYSHRLEPPSGLYQNPYPRRYQLKSTEKSRSHLFARLSPTVPVGLSVFLPYPSYHTRPLVHALQAGSELVSPGLGSLEPCVDNLTQEFLDALFSPIVDQVMVGLWNIVRPLPSNNQHTHTTMRILGEIRGINRKGFAPLKLEWKPVGPEALLNSEFEGKDTAIRIAPIVEIALEIIRRGDVRYPEARINSSSTRWRSSGERDLLPESRKTPSTKS